MTPRFIDTNVFLRFALRDDEAKAQRTRLLLARFEQGSEKAVTSPLVLFELVFTLHRTYKQPKKRVVGFVTAMLELRGLQVIGGKQPWHDAFRVWLQYAIDFTDAYNVAAMQSHDTYEIYAWDSGYDEVLGIQRIEPEETEEEAA
jgi:predicted nucleic acid-binding protein